MRTATVYEIRAQACLDAAHQVAMQPSLVQTDSMAITALATLAQANMQAADLVRSRPEVCDQ